MLGSGKWAARFSLDQASDHRVSQSCTASGISRTPSELIGTHGAQRAIGRYQLKTKQLFASGSVRNGSGARAVISHHAAHHTAVGGGGIGTEKQAVFLEVVIEFVSDNTGLNLCPSLLHIDVENGVHVPSGIEHGTIAYDLASEGSSCGAGNESGYRFELNRAHLPPRQEKPLTGAFPGRWKHPAHRRVLVVRRLVWS
jgi:hypothetical protein